MPSHSSGYTIEDFLSRLQNSPVSHMSGHYHENQLLFVHREELFVKAIMSLSWERGAALMAAAYHAQRIPVQVYRAMLARMLLHNRFVKQIRHESALNTSKGMHDARGALASSAGVRTLNTSSPPASHAFVPWTAALRMYSEAMSSYGTRCPTQLSRSVLRLLVPHHSWAAALSVLQLEQANERLTKPMLVDAARVCATPRTWETALYLLHHVHEQDENYLSEAIKALRPDGSNAFTAEAMSHALLPTSRRSLTPRQRHTVAVLADVVSAVPWCVALSLPLCQSYCTHLAASTTLSPQEKVWYLVRAMASSPWASALELLYENTEPSLVRVLPTRRAKDVVSLHSSVSASPSSQPSSTLSNRDEDVVLSLSDIGTPLGRLISQLGDAPQTLAALVASHVHKLPTPQAGLAFVQALRVRGSRGDAKGLSYALSHPVVRDALIRQCTSADDGWRLAVPLLVQESFRATPARYLTVLVEQLRRAKEVSHAIALLLHHIIPTQSMLEPAAMTSIMQCILAHNRYCSDQKERCCSSNESPAASAKETGEEFSLPRVDWRTALSILVSRQIPTAECRRTRTGTGPSSGAVALQPARVTAQENTPLTPAQLRLAVLICVDAASCLGAIRIMGYARRVNRTELPCSAEVMALLYCMHYDRYGEALAILRHAEERRRRRGADDAGVAALRHLVSLHRPWRGRGGI